jgi:hypothetical protein
MQGAGCGAGAATAAAPKNEAPAGMSNGLVPKQAAVAADAGALAEASTRTPEDKRRPLGGGNAAFNTNSKLRTGGPCEGKMQAWHHQRLNGFPQAERSAGPGQRPRQRRRTKQRRAGATGRSQSKPRR